MLKALFLISAFIFISVSAEGAEWTAWNNYTAQNPSTVLSGFQQPQIPSAFERYTDNSQGQSSYSVRANQYKYTSTSSMFGAKCNVICGLRSFLTVDQSSRLVCQRDMNSYFWGGFQGQFNSVCIPDVDKSPICTATAGPVLSNVGACSTQAYSNTNYQGMQCCYNDRNNIPGGNPDITTKLQSTLLYTLRNTE